MANKSIKDAFQRMWQHCVSSFATKEYVNNAVGSGGGASGGMSVKKIEFTDRQSAYAWLVENHTSVIRCVLRAAIVSTPIIYDSIEAAGGTFPAIRFTKLSFGIGNNAPIIGGVLLALTNTETMASLSAASVNFSSDGTFTLDDADITTLPDAYWPQVNASLEIYYMG